MGNAEASKKSASDSLKEYGRGVSGGLLFSVPLLYTMEVWWLGFLSSPARLLGFLAVTLLLLLGYNRFSGFREDATWLEVITDSIDSLGIGLVTAAAVLAILGRITTGMPLEIVIGKIAIEAGVVAIGISIGTAQLGSESSDDGSGKESRDSGKSGDSDEPRPSSVAFDEVVIGLFGGVAFAANVAPTEEIVLIASEISFPRLLMLAVFSFAVAAIILHYSEFKGSHKIADAETPWHVAGGAAATYAVALVTSATILWFVGRFDGAPTSLIMAQTVVLGFPTVLGASAARLLLQAR